MTLFVSGVPLHVTDRAFAAVFQQVSGFLTARLRTDRTRRVIGFVEYADAAAAALAKASLHGFKFPPVPASPAPSSSSSSISAASAASLSPAVHSSSPISAPTAASATLPEPGIVVQYARPQSDLQLRELELLESQHARAVAAAASAAVASSAAAPEERSSLLDAAAESVALNSFGAAAAVLQSKKKATLIAAATAAAAAANAVGVPSSAVAVAAVAVPASPAVVVAAAAPSPSPQPPSSPSPVSAAHTVPLPPADGVPHTPPPALKHPQHHRSTSYPLRASSSTTGGGGLFNGPSPDEARLNALLESGTITSTLYIEGLPLDATEREISHIFRPFDGYVSLRLRPTTSKRDPSVSFVLCFVEFDSPQRAAAALDARQGYQLSHDDRTLKITFANSARTGAPSTPKN